MWGTDLRRQGQLTPLTGPHCSLENQILATDWEKGLYIWATPTEDSGIQGSDTGHAGDMADTYAVTCRSHPVIKPLGDLRQISPCLNSSDYETRLKKK